jgi:hypothetical protein
MDDEEQARLHHNVVDLMMQLPTGKESGRVRAMTD